MKRPAPRAPRSSLRTIGWLAVLAMVALSVLSPAAASATNDGNGPAGNNGTLKVHEWGTASGTESNDPKVCVWNFEGFGFDVGQSGYIFIDGQGRTSGHFGPYAFGPTVANASHRSYAETGYFNDADGPTIPAGHYKATLYGKKTGGGVNLKDVKAKSKVFKVQCAAPTQTPEQPKPTPTPTPTPVPPTPTPTPTAAPGTPTPTPGGGEEGATPTPRPTPKPTKTPGGGVSGATGTPHLTLPPTDTELAATDAPASESWRMVLMGLAALLATVLLLTPPRSSIRRR